MWCLTVITQNCHIEYIAPYQAPTFLLYLKYNFLCLCFWTKVHISWDTNVCASVASTSYDCCAHHTHHTAMKQCTTKMAVRNHFETNTLGMMIELTRCLCYLSHRSWLARMLTQIYDTLVMWKLTCASYITRSSIIQLTIQLTCMHTNGRWWNQSRCIS